MEPAEPAASTTAPAEPAVSTTAPAVPAAASAAGGGPAPSGTRTDRGPRDMALSLALLLVPILLLIGLYRVFLDGDRPVAVDPGPAVAEARGANVFAVLVPGAPPKGWQLSTASFRRTGDGATLRLGYAGPGTASVQLLESSIRLESLLTAQLNGAATPVNLVPAGAHTWQLYRGGRGVQALVLADPGRTTAVVGAGDLATLRAVATTLP